MLRSNTVCAMSGYALKHRTRIERKPKFGDRYSIVILFKFKKLFEAECDRVIHENLECSDNFAKREEQVCRVSGLGDVCS